jgi:TRL-like protein family
MNCELGFKPSFQTTQALFMKIKLIIALILISLLPGCLSVYKTESHHHYGSEKIKEYGKTGKSCAYSLFGLLAFGDRTVDRARMKGGISEITFVEKQEALFFFIWAECTIVKGN